MEDPQWFRFTPRTNPPTPPKHEPDAGWGFVAPLEQFVPLHTSAFVLGLLRLTAGGFCLRKGFVWGQQLGGMIGIRLE